uniref:Uncharacterized protein n=1 Tax=Coccidioides posadasii RMSCC 3488 TaxID=454284 RepID=A0A0J6FVC7_COCPO|nr:hypothetical protein CPAG_09689 [Coccidioides posadasii RMSCC 3488]
MAGGIAKHDLLFARVELLRRGAPHLESNTDTVFTVPIAPFSSSDCRRLISQRPSLTCINCSLEKPEHSDHIGSVQAGRTHLSV